MADNQVKPDQIEHSGTVEHRVGKLEWRVDAMEPLVKNLDDAFYRGVGGQPSIISHIADTNTKLDYNNRRQDELLSVAKMILALFEKFGMRAIKLIGAIFILLCLWGVFGGWAKQTMHQLFPSWPVAKSVDAGTSSGIQSKPDKPADADLPPRARCT